MGTRELSLKTNKKLGGRVGRLGGGGEWVHCDGPAFHPEE